MHCRKILKKHDKMTNNELSSKMMPTVSDTLQKEQRKGALEGLKNSVVHEYAILAHRGGEDQAEMELGRHRRDQLTFERNTGMTVHNSSGNHLHEYAILGHRVGEDQSETELGQHRQKPADI